MTEHHHDEQTIDLGTLKPAEVRYTIGGKRYVLRECPEGDACAWRSFQAKTARFNEDGKFAGVGNIADSQPLLVSFCLFKADQQTGELILTDGDEPKPDLNHRVSLAVIRSWPARLVKPLFDKAMEISGLSERETREVLWKRLGDTVAKIVTIDQLERTDEDITDATMDHFLDREVKAASARARDRHPKNSLAPTTGTSEPAVSGDDPSTS